MEDCEGQRDAAASVTMTSVTLEDSGSLEKGKHEKITTQSTGGSVSSGQVAA